MTSSTPQQENLTLTAIGRHRPTEGRGGFMIIDVLAALTILIVGLSAVVGSLVASQRVRDRNRDMALAYEAARGQMEEMRATPFRDVFAAFNGTPLDDPPGPGAAPGSGFDVEGLSPQEGDPDGLGGRIEFPVTAGAPAVLREDVEIKGLGMPRDLNADIAIDDGDHSPDYALLPVRVFVEWEGPSGPVAISFETLLTAR